jgi:carbon-monoxide dehydrogenase medium subunit
MKAAAFRYACPATIDEAVALLAAGGGDAWPIAGGQSLVPMMAYRLARPSLLVDLRSLPGLDHIETGPQGVTLGAKVRWRDILAEPRLRADHPLLVAAVEHVAHYQIRNRGTVGGSLALADPAAELPGIAVTCGAEIAIYGPSGARSVKAEEFFVGALTTTLAHDELIVALKLPAWPATRRWAFEEFARRRGDFALAAIAAWYDEGAGARAVDTHIGVIGASDRPHRLAAAEVQVDGHLVDDTVIAAAARAAAPEVRPSDDTHASAAYRRALVTHLIERSLKQASLRDRATDRQ